jgi:L-ascorbate metabolism protein UlaG (beta-lactamase superfamily)
MKIQFIGHACFLIESEDYKVLIDPFITGNPLATVKAEDITPTHILLTHGHGDHVGDTVPVAKRTGAQVISTVEVTEEILAPAGLNVSPGNIGGKQATDFGSVKLVAAVHGSGVKGGLPCGFVIEIGGKKVYFAGDTALISEMSFLERANIDYAILPIGDHFTMGPEDASIAAELIKAKYVIPMHYNTMPPIVQDPNSFKEIVESKTDSEVIVMNPGEVLEV